MKEIVRVGPISAAPGSKVQGRLAVGELALGAEVALPIMIINGSAEGPVLWINGAVHGDELNGPVAARAIYQELNPGELRGTVIISPISNPLAFEARAKISNLDYLDLDQLFPGDPNGLLSQRIAYVLFEEIARLADYVVDLHTIGTIMRANPYTVYKRVQGVSPEISDQVEALALAFGVEPNCRLDLATVGGELPGTTSGALDIECIRRGIPAFMAEIGAGGRLEEENIAVAERGLRNVLMHLGMIEGTPERAPRQVRIVKRHFVRTSIGSMARMTISPGQVLQRGDAYASLFDFFGRESTLTADTEMWVIATRFNPVIETGDRLMFVGTVWEEVSR